MRRLLQLPRGEVKVAWIRKVIGVTGVGFWVSLTDRAKRMC